MPMRYDFWSNLLLMRKHYSQSLEIPCQTWSMTRAEMDVLLFLSHHPDLDRAADIVEHRGLTKSHVSIAVKQLCERGFLETTQDVEDHRVIHLKPTDEAAEVIEAGKSFQRCYWQTLFDGFSGEELVQLRYLQEKLFDNLRNMGEQNEDL